MPTEKKKDNKQHATKNEKKKNTKTEKPSKEVSASVLVEEKVVEKIGITNTISSNIINNKEEITAKSASSQSKDVSHLKISEIPKEKKEEKKINRSFIVLLESVEPINSIPITKESYSGSLEFKGETPIETAKVVFVKITDGIVLDEKGLCYIFSIQENTEGKLHKIFTYKGEKKETKTEPKKPMVTVRSYVKNKSGPNTGTKASMPQELGERKTKINAIKQYEKNRPVKRTNTKRKNKEPLKTKEQAKKQETEKTKVMAPKEKVNGGSKRKTANKKVETENS